MKYCQKCGCENIEEARFCLRCGFKFFQPVEKLSFSTLLSGLSPHLIILIGCIILGLSLFLPWETKLSYAEWKNMPFSSRFNWYAYNSEDKLTGLSLVGIDTPILTILFTFLTIYNLKFNRLMGLPFMIFTTILFFSVCTRYMWIYWSIASIAATFATIIISIGLYKSFGYVQNHLIDYNIIMKSIPKPRGLILIAILQSVVILLSPFSKIIKQQHDFAFGAVIDPLYIFQAFEGVVYYPILIFSALATSAFYRTEYQYCARLCLIGILFIYIYNVIANVIAYSFLLGKPFVPHWVQTFILCYSIITLFYLYSPKVMKYFRCQLTTTS